MIPELVDGYCHCGLRKYRPIEDVRRFMDRLRLSRAVLVQHLGEYDNRYIGNILAEHPGRYAGAMLVDPDHPDAATQLAQCAQRYPFRGVRFLARTLLSHPELWQQAANLGLNIVVYEEPTIAAYSDDLRTFAAEHSRTRIVISHLGRLDRSEAPGYDSHRRLAVLSDCPNVYVQLSGFHMFGEYPYADQLPIVGNLVEWFGLQRLLFGTNFPIPRSEQVSQQELDLLRGGQLGVPAQAIEQILSRTALDLWFDGGRLN